MKSHWNGQLQRMLWLVFSVVRYMMRIKPIGKLTLTFSKLVSRHNILNLPDKSYMEKTFNTVTLWKEYDKRWWRSELKISLYFVRFACNFCRFVLHYCFPFVKSLYLVKSSKSRVLSCQFQCYIYLCIQNPTNISLHSKHSLQKLNQSKFVPKQRLKKSILHNSSKFISWASETQASNSEPALETPLMGLEFVDFGTIGSLMSFLGLFDLGPNWYMTNLTRLSLLHQMAIMKTHDIISDLQFCFFLPQN